MSRPAFPPLHDVEVPRPPEDAPKWDGYSPLRTGVVVLWLASPINGHLAKVLIRSDDVDGEPAWDCDVYPRPGSNNFGVWITAVPISQIRRHPDAPPLVVPKFTTVAEADEWLAAHSPTV